ncbi:hypothetical protein HY58_05740 [Flavihumibacter sp. ZG627]|nr:hypothetical protein HY58_05740 [Flavihumibacter sp. ZG627]
MKNATLAKNFEPNEKICFDKRFSIKGLSGARRVLGCFMVDTKRGITAAKPLQNEIIDNCSLDISRKKFLMILFGMKGNEYIYFNREEKMKQSDPSTLHHYVSTGNTHKDPLQSVIGEKMLYKKQQTCEFCNGKYKAFEYRSADMKDILYLYGKDYPGDVKAYSYLGAYGLGYLKTDKGNYFVMSFEHGNTQLQVSEVEDLENLMACFDPSVFQIYEETKVVEMLQETEDRTNELNQNLVRDEQKMLNTNFPCAAKKYALNVYKNESNEKQKELLEMQSNDKIAYSNKADVLKVASRYDPTASIKMDRLQTEYNLCILKSDVESGKWSKNPDNYSKAIAKINCWENKVNEYKKMEDDIKAIDVRYSNDKEKAVEEKMKYQVKNIGPKMGTLRCNL